MVALLPAPGPPCRITAGLPLRLPYSATCSSCSAETFSRWTAYGSIGGKRNRRASGMSGGLGCALGRRWRDRSRFAARTAEEVDDTFGRGAGCARCKANAGRDEKAEPHTVNRRGGRRNIAGEAHRRRPAEHRGGNVIGGDPEAARKARYGAGPVQAPPPDREEEDRREGACAERRHDEAEVERRGSEPACGPRRAGHDRRKRQPRQD